MAYTNIDDPSAYFQAKGYAGNSVDNTAITNDGNSDLQPDLIWFARYDTPANKFLLDSSRGVTKFLISSDSDAEGTSTSIVKSFDTNGFSVGTNSNSNSSSSNYVAWQWKANGGTTSSNTDGSITSTVQANQDAGFSIVTYTGNGDPYGNTFGHGLGVAPKMVIVKRRSGTEQSWAVYHEAIGAGNYLRLNGTNTSTASSAHWYNTAPTSTLVYVGGNGEVNGSSETYVAYAFAEKQGYSKFGKVVGNGSTDGAFVYTGFKPAVIILKRTDSARNWNIITGATIQKNVIDERFNPNLGNIQSVGDWADFISNGFKLRTTNAAINASGGTYIYMAFAENPFTTSTGIPTTAR
jgi:hypothetical protein